MLNPSLANVYNIVIRCLRLGALACLIEPWLYGIDTHPLFLRKSSLCVDFNRHSRRWLCNTQRWLVLCVELLRHTFSDSRCLG